MSPKSKKKDTAATAAGVAAPASTSDGDAKSVAAASTKTDSNTKTNSAATATATASATAASGSTGKEKDDETYMTVQCVYSETSKLAPFFARVPANRLCSSADIEQRIILQTAVEMAAHGIAIVSPNGAPPTAGDAKAAAPAAAGPLKCEVTANLTEAALEDVTKLTVAEFVSHHGHYLVEVQNTINDTPIFYDAYQNKKKASALMTQLATENRTLKQLVDKLTAEVKTLRAAATAAATSTTSSANTTAPAITASPA